MRHDLGLGEAMHLLAHGSDRLVEAGIAIRHGTLRAADQRNGAGAGGGGGGGDEVADIGGEKRRLVLFRHAKLMRARDLALAHRHAAGELRGIFGGADLREQSFHLAEAAFVRHAVRIGCDLVQRLGIGGDPGKPVRRVLLALERVAIDLAALADLAGNCVPRAVAQAAGRLCRRV